MTEPEAMTPVELLLTIQAMVPEVEENWDSIVRLLRANRDRAEVEVARFLVTQAVAEKVSTRLRSGDPRERLAGVEMAVSVYTRSSLAGGWWASFICMEHPCRPLACWPR